MAATLMHLKVLLPHEVFADERHVTRIVADSWHGSFGILPRRLDCAASLAPGILTFESEHGGERYFAVDAGVLVKTGAEVLVSVRNAIGGTDLGMLREAVEREFLNLDDREKQVRSVLARLESGFVRRFMEFRHE
jgi:F-type H+-transporting ATPase subunit epsilon